MSLYKFDKDKDYMEERNRLAAAGDKQGAANAERMRNQKIDALGLNYNKTYDYLDIGEEAKSLMQSNAPWQQVAPLAPARVNKASTNPQYSQYLNDDVQDSIMRYIANGMAGEKPVYQNKRQASIDELYDRVVNGKEFSYDVNSDPVYQAYKEQYTREGQRAMQDTLASLSQDAGGENSWAVSAASQANNRYMQELADKVPELYNLAYEMYLSEQNADMNRLALARDMENAEYGRYLDAMNVYQADRAYADNWYNNYYNQSRADKQWNYNTAMADVQRSIEAGVMPSAELLQRAGLTGSEAAIQAQVNDVIRDNKFNTAVQGYELEGLAQQKRANELAYKMDELAYQEALNQMMYTPTVVKSGGREGTKPPEGPDGTNAVEQIGTDYDTVEENLNGVYDVSDKSVQKYIRNALKPMLQGDGIITESAIKEHLKNNSKSYDLEKADIKNICEALGIDKMWVDDYKDSGLFGWGKGVKYNG